MARRSSRSTRKRSRSRKPRRKSNKRNKSLLRRILMWGVPLAVLVAAGYVFYLDYTIRSQFEGRRWELPARVYARPLELYPGMVLDPGNLVFELHLVRYRPVGRATEPGSYSRSADRFHIISRPFTFWDGKEPSHDVRLRVDGGVVTALTDARSGKALPLVRLDPALIASIYPSHNEDRILVRVSDVPQDLVKGLIAVEDRDFYHHHGINPRAIARALWANLRAGRTVQGGSTLTQQLVKNYFLSNRRTLWRKANEAVMALLLELHYDKREILESYLNEVYLGQDGKRSIHGFGLASQFYFQRPVQKLDLAQVALLVGLVKGPSYYDPRRHPHRALARRNLVLDVMAQQHVVSAAEADRAKHQPLGVTATAPSGVSPYPAFLDLVRRQLRRDYREEDLTSEGLQIFTTLDPTVQRDAEQGLEAQIRRLEHAHRLKAGTLQGAIVVTHTDSGEVAAVVGGRDPRFAGFNRALDAVRQVGSLIKPAVYLAALSQPQRYTLATLLEDSPLQVRDGDGKVWAPHNYDRQYHGQVLLYRALAHSYNVPTARLGMNVGLGVVVDTLRRLGIRRPIKAYPSMLLGAVPLSPLEVSQMYQTLAAGGFRTPLRSIRAVLTADGAPLSRYPLTVKQVARPDSVFLLDTALEKVVEEGTGTGVHDFLPPDVTAAGKTGTTDDMRDSWFAGFTNDYLAVVWLGTDDNQPTGLTGSSGALRVWGRVMQSLRPRALSLTAPDDVVYAWIDPGTGLPTRKDCEGAVQLPFIKGSVPEGEAPCKNKGLDWLQRIFK
ncbi:MAG: penicillin-binding protein 1B [Gammaproteobacteria bacterium]